MALAKAAECDTDPQLAELWKAIGEIGGYVRKLKERIRLLEAVIENFPGGISLFDNDLHMVLCNEQQKRMLEYPDELMAKGYPSLEELFRFNAMRGEYGPGDIEMHVKRKLELVRRREPHCYDRTRPNGTIVEVRGVPLEGGGFVTTYLDVTEQRRNQQLVAHMAQHDPLTDLPNRILFHDRLKTALAQVKRGGMMAVHDLDLDNFKPVNDNLGHQAGDELLVGIASRMRQSVREHDTIARLGGDEFAVVQTAIRKPQDAATLASRLLNALAKPMKIAGREVQVSLSIGIAIAPDDGLTSDDLLIKADSALYHSKSRGKGCFKFFREAA